MGIRFVQEEYGTRVQSKVGQQKEGLLKAPARTGQVQANAGVVAVGHLDFAPFGNVDRLIEFDLKQIELDEPVNIAERGEIQMTYRDNAGIRLDLSCSGRGLQQTLLLLAYLALHPGSVLLLDEPDAHLELLRQREIYLKLREYARQSGGQLIIASHSEV